MIAGGVDWIAVQKAMRACVVAGSGLSLTKCVWGQQDAGRPPAPAIVMRVSNIAEEGTTWLTTQDNPLVFSPLVVTAINASANTFTVANHGLATGDGPIPASTTGVLPLNLPATVWAVVVDANTLKLASTFLNAMNGQPDTPTPITIDIGNAGSGVLTLSSNGSTVRAGAELMAIVRGTLRVTLELHCHSSDAVGMLMATSLLQNIRTRRKLPTMSDILLAANISVLDIDRVRALIGIKDASLFEPRALLEIHFGVPLEDGEPIRRIDIVEITNLLQNHVTTVSNP